MTFESAPEIPDGLTESERTCLLRAARIELMRLKDAFYRLQDMESSETVLKAAAAEVQCLSLGIEWLWRDGIAAHERKLHGH